MKRILALLCCALLLALPALAQPPAYPELKVGMRDAAVAKLKERLFELGYFRSQVVNLNYTEDTANAIRDFQKVNGLPVDGIASPALQELFYSDRALPKQAEAEGGATPAPYREPEVPLALGEMAYTRWEGEVLWFNPQVQNLSREKALTGFELVYYARDDQGQLLPAKDGTPYTRKAYSQAVGADQRAFAGETELTAYPTARRLFVAVSQLQFAQGEPQVIAPEDYHFAAWTLEARP